MIFPLQEKAGAGERGCTYCFQLAPIVLPTFAGLSKAVRTQRGATAFARLMNRDYILLNIATKRDSSVASCRNFKLTSDMRGLRLV